MFLFLVSQVLGFGLMDAEALVTKAKTWVSIPEQVSCSTSEFYVAEYVWYKFTNVKLMDDLKMEAIENIIYNLQTNKNLSVIDYFKCIRIEQ